MKRSGAAQLKIHVIGFKGQSLLIPAFVKVDTERIGRPVFVVPTIPWIPTHVLHLRHIDITQTLVATILTGSFSIPTLAYSASIHSMRIIVGVAVDTIIQCNGVGLIAVIIGEEPTGSHVTDKSGNARSTPSTSDIVSSGFIGLLDGVKGVVGWFQDKEIRMNAAVVSIGGHGFSVAHHVHGLLGGLVINKVLVDVNGSFQHERGKVNHDDKVVFVDAIGVEGGEVIEGNVGFDVLVNVVGTNVVWMNSTSPNKNPVS
mmetsp:Transcript_8738/g.13513  ORF Transcript_8738/g.13513 Transcript_8738/m.13513 type:complete len:258 (+) Transcript_8738:1350-2123(+)